MGDGMAGPVAKGSVLILVDRIFNDRQRRPDVVAKLEAELKQGQRASLAEFLKTIGVHNRDLLKHFREHISNNQPPGWWPIYPDKDLIVLTGVRKAFEVAQEGGLDLDLDSYWVCAGNHFQTIVTRSAHQVNLLFLSPPMPANVFYPSVSVPDDVWIACSEGTAKAIDEVAGYPVGDVLGHPTGQPRPADELPEFEPGLRFGGVQVARPKRSPLPGESAPTP